MPRKDRTFTPHDLTRFACRNLGPEEQAKIVHYLIEKECFPIEFTPDQVEKIICQHMEPSARRQLMKRLITESVCDGENKTISCQTIGAIKTTIDALTMLMENLEIFSGHTAALTRSQAIVYVARTNRHLVRPPFRSHWCS